MADIIAKAESKMTVALLKNLSRSKWFPLFCAVVFILLTLASRICVAYFLATDEPGDGRVYTQLAANLLEQKIFSLDDAPPFAPTLIRLPGYPLFIAAVYYFFGNANELAVRIVQAFFDTVTCIIAAAVAWQMTADENRRRKNAAWTFALMALCPFTMIYVAALLTETLTIFLLAAMTLTAIFALKKNAAKKSLGWWILTGLLAGAAVLLRPDSGLFAAGIGLTLVVSGLFIKTENAPKFARRVVDVGWRGAVFSLCFILVLAPWTIRNYRVFHLFQPLAPAHAEMPGEFVPHGYDRWLRTWIDDWRFVEPMLWNLDEKPINVKRIPASAFDSDEERARVAALLEQYNNPPGNENQTNSWAKSDDNSDEDVNSDDEKSDDSADDSANADDDKNDDSSGDEANSDEDKGDDAQTDSVDGGDEHSDDDENKHYVVRMTPEIDAGFAAIADERIERAPVRYYVSLPVKRAVSQWFDTHSLYYPFGGELSPTDNLDYDEHQEFWLPVFAAAMWIYTLLAFGGAFVLWRGRRNPNSLRWLLLVLLMTLPRVAFLSSVENPEPRYVVELFVFTSVLGGLFIGNFKSKKEKSLEIDAPDFQASTRLLSLDVFRGMTVAAMVLVNSPGNWAAIYAPLEHAEWNGATTTDFVFPFFLFIVGASISFALGKRCERESVDGEIYRKILRRSSLLFALGLLVATFPFYDLAKGEFLDVSSVRIMGVLQRIAVCYLVSALIFLKTNWKQQTVIVIALLLIYWALMTLIKVPGCEITTFNDRACNLAAYVDRAVLGENHLWKFSKVFDPEGLLSTIPAVATTLTGVLAGQWLRRKKDENEKAAAMLFCGIALAAIGLIWSFWFPLNKTLWTSSFVLVTSGAALCFFGFLYLLVDIKGYRSWSKPFVIFGTNAIALYVGSSIMATVFDLIKLQNARGRTVSLQEAIFNRMFLPFASPVAASLAYAVSFVLTWLFFMWILYRKRIFIKA